MYIVIRKGKVVREGSKSSCARYAELMGGKLMKLQAQPAQVV